MLLIGALSANQYLEEKNLPLQLVPKGFKACLVWLQNEILSGVLSIIIFKADDSIVFGVVKLKSPYQSGPAKSRSQPGTDVNTPGIKQKRTVM